MNEALAARLALLEVNYQHFTHRAVFSTADVALLPEKLPGTDTKNLFLRDEKRTQYILVCVRAETRVNLKELGRQLAIKGITFASPEEMQELLGVSPGSVCLFSLMHDSDRRVAAYIDASIPEHETIQNHPLVNTETVVISVMDMARFCESVGHPLRRIDIPERIAPLANP